MYGLVYPPHNEVLGAITIAINPANRGISTLQKLADTTHDGT